MSDQRLTDSVQRVHFLWWKAREWYNRYHHAETKESVESSLARHRVFVRKMKVAMQMARRSFPTDLHPPFDLSYRYEDHFFQDLIAFRTACPEKPYRRIS